MQGTLESAWSRLVGQEIATVGAGRTDRGVHALAQVVHADLDTAAPRAQRFLADLPDARRRLDRLVGPPITIWAVRSVDAGFDARFSATERAYRYTIVDAVTMSPLQRHRCWHVGEPLATDAMQVAAAALLGEHDFASFCRRSRGGHTVRRLDAIDVARADGGVAVSLRGPAFCHQLVRSVVGCLVDVGRGRRPPAWLADVLEARDRRAAAAVAPPHGLVLERISYGSAYPSAPP